MAHTRHSGHRAGSQMQTIPSIKAAARHPRRCRRTRSTREDTRGASWPFRSTSVFENRTLQAWRARPGRCTLVVVPASGFRSSHLSNRGAEDTDCRRPYATPRANAPRGPVSGRPERCHALVVSDVVFESNVAMSPREECPLTLRARSHAYHASVGISNITRAAPLPALLRPLRGAPHAQGTAAHTEAHPLLCSTSHSLARPCAQNV